ncbi:MAG TPA: gamma-glutamyl-gamma-aminobutyrate hydrolase family protein [Solirubrobacteraceae bacterium]|nr:gamma-glutamyl-gamma-aminobutyrate hydrolase family protein [Solirubrobacteraceae bacterium]
MRPVIGICGAIESARWGVWDQRAVLTPLDYVRAVQEGGGLAVIVPPDPAFGDVPDQLLEHLDGLILAGGADVDPSFYGAEPHPATIGTAPARDAAEIALTREAIERDLPVLGICRGMQLLNVARGGTLIQHLPESHGHDGHRPNPGSFDGSDLDVHLADGSLARHAAGEQVHLTKQHHHQAVDVLGDGLVVTGWSALDDLPEAVELPGRRFVLGVQWHPEADPDSGVIGAFVAACRTAPAAG